MADNLSKLRTAVGMGLGKVATTSPPPLSGDSADLEIYKKLKSSDFRGLVDKYGPVQAVTYISTMERLLKRKSGNG